MHDLSGGTRRGLGCSWTGLGTDTCLEKSSSLYPSFYLKKEKKIKIVGLFS